MDDEEFRKLYCWMIDQLELPWEKAEKLLQRILETLAEERGKADLP